MELRRVLLYFALFLVCFSLWTNWQNEHHLSSSNSKQNNKVSRAKKSDYVLNYTPVIQKKRITVSKNNLLSASFNSSAFVKVNTDVLSLKIDLKGGKIVDSYLLHYPKNLDSSKPYILLNSSQNNYYVAESGLLQSNSKQQPKMNFVAAKRVYTLQPNQKYLSFVLSFKGKNGVRIEKIFHFTRGSYLIKVNYKITNNSNNVWNGFLYTQLIRKMNPSDIKNKLFHTTSYKGAAISEPEHLYKKLSFSTIRKKDLDKTIKGGWLAMQEHYFLSSWIPNQKQENHYYTRNQDNTYLIGMHGPVYQLDPGKYLQLGAKLYIGPELTEVLKTIAPGLNLTVDYGMLWFISTALFWIMQHIYSLIGNWGWSIVILTFLIKILFYGLSAKSYRSMGNMRKLQPKIQEIKDNCGGDKAKLSKEMMQLYKKEKVNPLSGCLPILIQIPVFIALYWVLLESVQLRQAPFILWIKDLAAPDPYYILPLILGLTMFIQQKLNPAPADPTQEKIMMLLPAVFTFLFLHFPTGLVVYWIVNNGVSILQQWYITRQYS